MRCGRTSLVLPCGTAGWLTRLWALVLWGGRCTGGFLRRVPPARGRSGPAESSMPASLPPGTPRSGRGVAPARRSRRRRTSAGRRPVGIMVALLVALVAGLLGGAGQPTGAAASGTVDVIVVLRGG